MTRHRELLESDELAAAFPIFRDAERVIADPVVRNRGTLGGSLCQADPSEDLSAVCTTLDASCVIRGSAGERVVTMEEFHRGPYETAVGDAEMLIEVRIPLRPDGSSAYEKVERRAGDWAVVSAGAAVWMDGGLIADARVGLAAVGPNTTGHPGDLRRAARPGAVRGAVRAGRRDRRRRAVDPATDVRGSADVQASPGRRAHPAGAAPRRGPHRRRSPEHAGDDDRQRRRGHPRDRGSAAAGALPARPPRPDRHALGLRHQQLRHLRGLDGRRAGQVVHRAGRDGRRARGPHGRGPRAGRRARPGPAGLHGVPRPAVRLLHARHADDRAGPARPQPGPVRAGDPRGDLRADLPLHRLRHDRPLGPVGRRRRGRHPYRGRRRPRHDRRQERPAALRRQRPEAGRARPDAAQGGPALHPRQGPLRRRRPAARHAAPGDPALPGGARPDRQHRHHARAGPPEGQGRRHRRDAGRAGAGLDADPVQRRAGRAGHRQGALPGPGGRVRRRRGPLLGPGRARADRRRVRRARAGHRRAEGAGARTRR